MLLSVSPLDNRINGSDGLQTPPPSTRLPFDLFSTSLWLRKEETVVKDLLQPPEEEDTSHLSGMETHEGVTAVVNTRHIQRM